MTDEERETINAFKAGISLLTTGPDGFPTPGQALELDVLGQLLLKVDMICHLGDTAEDQSLLRLTDATSRLIAAAESDDRDPAIPEAWFRARAELVEPR